MISALRKIRQQLLKRKRFQSYLLYAIGEIFLVVIGIIIALSLNSWNSQRLEKQDIQEYYKKLIVELQESIESVKRGQEDRDMAISRIIDLQEAINTGSVDSLMKVKSNFNALFTGSYSYDRKYPVFDEFVKNNYFSKINNSEIKLGAKNLNQMIASQASSNAYSMNQHQNIILPFVLNNLNYSEICEYSGEIKIKKRGAQISYDKLINNMELWNILALKLENLRQQNSKVGGALYVLSSFKGSLEEELNK